MGKVIVITGASSGIGLATANYFFEHGYIVYGIGRRALKESDVKFHYYSGDICDSERMKEIAGDIYNKEGRIDILFNNAGSGIGGNVEYTPIDEIAKHYNIDVVAHINMCQIYLPYLRETQGKIIFTSSVAACTSVSYQAVYSSCKAAIEAFALALAKEVKNQNIKITCIRPGDIKSGFTDSRFKPTQTNEYYRELEAKKIVKMEKYERNGINPVVVAKHVYKIARRKNPPLISSVGFAYKLVSWAMKVVPVRFAHYLVYKIY